MTNTDTAPDVTKLEAAEGTLQQAVRLLECVVDEDLPVTHTQKTRRLKDDLELVVEQLNDALDCLQIGLGRPYVWLLARAPGYGWAPEDDEDDAADAVDAECVDCGTETLPVDDRRAEWYIVADEVWAAAHMAPNGCLCIGCLEARIGRQLTPADFPADIGINNLSITDDRKAWSWRTPRLIARLSGQLPAVR
jgi:hypothetical protein